MKMDEKNESNVVLYEETSTLSLIFQNYQDSSSDNESNNDISSDILSDDEISKEALNPLKTKGELDLCDLPPIETLTISVEEEQCKPIGNIKSIVDTLVVVEAFINVPPLDIDSVLFVDRGKRALGRIFEVVGPVNKPYYTIRFNDSEQIQKLDVQVKETVYCAPQTDYTSYVFISKAMEHKGSDASWKDNNEPPPEYIDYSDDEKEKLAKKNKKNSKKSQNSKNTCKNNELNTNHNQQPPAHYPQHNTQSLGHHESLQQHQPMPQHQPVQQHQPMPQHQPVQQHQPMPQHQLVKQHQPMQQHHQLVQQHQPIQHQPMQQHQPIHQYQPLQPLQHYQHHSLQQESPYQPFYSQSSNYAQTTPIMPPRFGFQQPQNQYSSFPPQPQIFSQFNQPSYPQNLHNIPPGFNAQHRNYM